MWVERTSLLNIRPAEVGEMVAPGQFAKLGDMIIESRWCENDFLIHPKDFEKNYVEVEVID